MKVVNLDVALDSNGKYIKANEAVNGEDYFCPDCNEVVHVRAVNSRSVTPHFYHLVKGNCNGESAMHKYWKSKLFCVGDKVFIHPIGYVTITHRKEEHRFDNINGRVYQPDIFVKTDNDNFKYLFIEIFNTSKKKVDKYIDIWESKKFGVVEIDIKTMDSNEEYDSFSLLYNPYEKKVTTAYMYVKHIGKDNKDIECYEYCNMNTMKKFKNKLVKSMVKYESYQCVISRDALDSETRVLMKDVYNHVSTEFDKFAKFIKIINEARVKSGLRKIFYDDHYYTYKKVEGKFIKEYED